VISARMADPGDFAAVGKPLYRLLSTQGGRLEVRLPSEVLAQVHKGTEVILSQNNQTLAVVADRVFPSLDQRSLGHLDVDLTTIPFNKVPGALIHARVITQSVDQALLVPEDSLLSSANHTQGVLRVTHSVPRKVQFIPVKILFHAKEGVAVQGALQSGDNLVVAHETTLLKLHNGDRVIIEEQK